MKIREFFAVPGFNPEECGSGCFFLNGKPFCPIAKAGVLRGYDPAGPDAAAGQAEGIYAKFGLDYEVAGRFWNTFDQYRSQFGLVKAFEKALDVAEQCEKALEAKQK